MMILKISRALFSLISLALIIHSRAQDTPQDYVNAHNTARAAVGVKPVTWDDTVAAYAQNNANQRVNDCNLVHSGGRYRENLGWSGADGADAGTAAVKMWVDEKQYYNYTSNYCAADKQCGHYTQVVWRNSVLVGCGAVNCTTGGTLTVCNYDPPGNFIGQRPY